MRTTGLFQHPLFHRHLFATPAVRHLSWLIHSRPLLSTNDGQAALQPWPADIETRLLDLDADPRPLQAHLAQRPARRLGLYFEQLYGYALTALLGQEILAQNLPVRAAGRTLGELDFLVYDPHRDRVIHHEIAVKFYLGWIESAGGKPSGWYGPDTRDQLSRKLKRLQEHQIPLWRSETGLRCLQSAGLPQPQASHLGLYGYLFQRHGGALPPLPANIAPPDPGVTWRPAPERTEVSEPDAGLAVVTKPDWLGPVQYPADYRPDRERLEEALGRARGRPVLMARLERTREGFWLESARQFLTPENWCRADLPS